MNVIKHVLNSCLHFGGPCTIKDIVCMHKYLYACGTDKCLIDVFMYCKYL